MTSLVRHRQITLHMLIRWLERIEGIDLDAVRAEMREVGHSDLSDSAVIKYLERWHCLNLIEVESRILSREVRAALALGAKSIRFGDVKIVIKPDGEGSHVLATIVT